MYKLYKEEIKMYKAQYFVENYNGGFWCACNSDKFVDRDGEYINLFKTLNNAVEVAKEWKASFGGKVRIVKWMKGKRYWKVLGNDI